MKYRYVGTVVRGQEGKVLNAFQVKPDLWVGLSENLPLWMVQAFVRGRDKPHGLYFEDSKLYLDPSFGSRAEVGPNCWLVDWGDCIGLFRPDYFVENFSLVTSSEADLW